MLKCCACEKEFEDHDLEDYLQEEATCDEERQAYCEKCRIIPEMHDDEYDLLEDCP